MIKIVHYLSHGFPENAINVVVGNDKGDAPVRPQGISSINVSKSYLG
jgi:hypothetical protein